MIDEADPRCNPCGEGTLVSIVRRSGRNLRTPTRR